MWQKDLVKVSMYLQDHKGRCGYIKRRRQKLICWVVMGLNSNFLATRILGWKVGGRFLKMYLYLLHLEKEVN